MSAFPELTKLPNSVWCGLIGDCYSTVQTDEGIGLLVFMSEEDHKRSTIAEQLKGTNPVHLTRSEVLDLCDICYLVDPDIDEYVSFVINDVEVDE